jgi:hypothetical protein
MTVFILYFFCDVTLLSPIVTTYTNCCNIQLLFILLTGCTYGFHIILMINSD